MRANMLTRRWRVVRARHPRSVPGKVATPDRRLYQPSMTGVGVATYENGDRHLEDFAVAVSDSCPPGASPRFRAQRRAGFALQD